VDIINKAFQEFEVGTLIVNEGTGFRIESLPFGGVKDSGIGREGIRYAINEFTTLKTLIM
jgi:glyceraldehyde-3-phosphate dehydrogenase (NADP+)